MKTKLKYTFTVVFLLLFATAVIIYPERYVKTCFEGFKLWAECVLPSLFPFMIITLILIKTGIAESVATPFARFSKFLRLPYVACILFPMSICSGYPAGSRTVFEYFDGGYIGTNDAKKLSLLCSTSGPLFIIGSVGYKIFGDKSVGIKMLIAHVLANLIIAVIYSFISRSENKPCKPLKKKSDNILYDCFYSGVTAVALAGGFIAFFYTFAQICIDFKLLHPIYTLMNLIFSPIEAQGICYGLIEATGGCVMVARAQTALSVPICGALITFGGLSIICQQLCYLVKCKVQVTFFIFFKMLQAVLCFFILLIAT